MMHRRAVLLAGVGLLAGPAMAQEGVPALVGLLAQEKSYAESGAGLLKQWVMKPATLLRGQRLYAEASAASDRAIARLAASLAAGQAPDRDEMLLVELDTAVEKRLAFSRHVDAALDTLAGKKGAIGDALGKAAGEIVKGVLASAVEVWKTWHATDENRRETLMHQVEQTKWRSFGEVPAG